MTSELTIRTADQNDLPALIALYSQLHPNDEPVSPAVGARLLDQLSLYPGSSIVLGLRGDAVVATCTLIIIPNLTRRGAPYALIENVVTDAHHRKRGYGKAILHVAIATAWRQDCYKVMLLTGSGDPATLRFYQEVGFEQSKTGFQVRRMPPRR